MIPVYDPVFTEDDALAAANAVRSGILSAFGPEVKLLEENICNYVGSKYALACSSGTTGLYLALYGVGVRSGDLVVVPTCSFAATAFAASHIGARIRFIDSDINSWNLDLNELEQICQVSKIKAVIAVHNYGNPIDMVVLLDLSRRYGFAIIEDACEALSAKAGSKMVGSVGDVGVFSFYGNKLLAGGEGGVVVTHNKDVYESMKLMRGQGQDPNRRFWHLMVGHNFRMTNVQAAIINSQFKRINDIVKKKRLIYECYRKCLDEKLLWQLEPPGHKSCWWMVSVRFDMPGWYKKASDFLLKNEVETRPIFPAIHSMPAFPAYKNVSAPVADKLHDTAVTLPSGPGLRGLDVERICGLVNRCI